MSDTDFADSRLGLLLDYWRSKCGGERAPQREALDPLDIPRLLPILNLIDVERDPLVFRHRLVGTELVEKLGRDATGREVGDGLYNSACAEIAATLKTIVDEIRPYRRLARLDWHERRWLTMESLELPLLGPDGQVSRILRGSTFGIVHPPLPDRLSFEPIG